MAELTLPWEAFQALHDAVEANLPDASLRPQYGGRAMYGGTCIALVTDDVSGLVRFTFLVDELVGTLDEDVAERLGAMADVMRETRTRVDQMGHQLVYYWPRIEVAA